MCPFYNLKNSLRFEALQKCKGTLHVEHILFLTELWHLLDVNAVAGHGAVLSLPNRFKNK